MHISRRPFVYFLIFSIASVIFWLGLRIAGAQGPYIWQRVNPRDFLGPRVNGRIFLPDTGGETPAPTPLATPEPPDSEEYSLDANDYLGVVAPDGLSLNVDGLALDKISGHAGIYFELTPLSGADLQPLALQLWLHDGGKYDLRFPDFEEGNYRLTMTYPKGSTPTTHELKPHSRILFSGEAFQAILFAGEDVSAADATPDETVTLDGEESPVLLVGPKGSLALRATPVSGDFTLPTPVPTPNPPDGGSGPKPGGGNPPTGNPPLGGGPNPPSTPSTDFRLGGGGGVFSCSLQRSVRPDPIPPILVMIGIFFFPLASIRLLRRAR